MCRQRCDRRVFVASSPLPVKGNYWARSKELQTNRLPMIRAVHVASATIGFSCRTGSVDRLRNCQPKRKTKSVIGRKQLLPGCGVDQNEAEAPVRRNLIGIRTFLGVPGLKRQ